MNGRLPVVAMVVIVLGVAWSAPADACERPPPCRTAQLAPADGALLPSNAGLLFVPPEGEYFDGGTPESASLGVSAVADGGVAPFRSVLLPSGAYDVRPELAPDTRYTVEYVDGCYPYETGIPPPRFTTAGPAELPDRIGVVVVHAEGSASSPATSGSAAGRSCPAPRRWSCCASTRIRSWRRFSR